MNKSRFLIAAAIAAFAVAPAFAQEASSGATLRVDVGSAMASNGGEFSTVASGTQLAPGSRVMLAEGNQATLVYANGCTQALKEAGVYTVSATCVAAAAPGGAATAGATGAVDVGGAGIVTGIAVGGAAILNSMDERAYQPPPPVSR